MADNWNWHENPHIRNVNCPIRPNLIGLAQVPLGLGPACYVTLKIADRLTPDPMHVSHPRADSFCKRKFSEAWDWSFTLLCKNALRPYRILSQLDKAPLICVFLHITEYFGYLNTILNYKVGLLIDQCTLPLSSPWSLSFRVLAE